MRYKVFITILYMLLMVLFPLSAWQPSITVSLKSEYKDTDVMFYWDSLSNPVLDADHHSDYYSIQHGKQETIKCLVDEPGNLNSIRIDLNKDDLIDIYSLTVYCSPFYKIMYSNDEMKDLFSLYNDISSVEIVDDHIKIIGCGDEAWLFAENIISSGKGRKKVVYENIFYLLMYGILFFVLLNFRYRHISFKSKVGQSIVRVSHVTLIAVIGALYFDRVVLKLIYKICCLCSAQKLISYFSPVQSFSLSRILFWIIIITMIIIMSYLGFEKTVKYRYVLSAVLFCFLILGKYNISSIGAFDKMLLNSSGDYNRTVVLGDPQGIRADEWAIEKPYYFAQTSGVDLPYYNYNLMIDGADMVVMAFAPVKDLMILTRPSLLGFLFLPTEYAFSFYWWFRIFMLFLGGFELGRILLKNDKLAVLASVALFFSGPIQWLMSQWLIEIIYAGMWAIVFWHRLLKARILYMKIIISIILAFWINVYIYALYPAAEIPFGYLFASMAIYCIYDAVVNKKNKLNFDSVICLSIVILVVVGVAVHFWGKSGEAIQTMANTVYPGKNRVWGTYTWDYELFSFINLFSANFKDSNYLNNCESAKFVYFLPFLAVSVFAVWKQWKSDTRIIGLAMIFVVTLIMFLFCYCPNRNVITDVVFLRNSYPRRIYLAVGFGFFWCLWLLVSILITKERILSDNVSKTIAVLMFVIYLTLAMKSKTLLDYFSFYNYGLSQIVIISLCFLYCCTGYLLINNGYRNIRAFVVIYVFLNLFSTALVNPLSVGTDCLYKKDSLKMVRSILSEDPNGRWMISGNAGIGNLVSAQGVKRCSGYYYYPDVKMMKIIDPDEKYRLLWNRFSAVDMRLTTGDNYIESPEGGPSIVVYINKKTARELGIKYIFNYNYDMSDYLKCCLSDENIHLLYSDEIDNVTIYQVDYQ